MGNQSPEAGGTLPRTTAAAPLPTPASPTPRPHASPAIRLGRHAEIVAWVALLVLCLAVGVLMLFVGGGPLVPSWLWTALLLGCLLSLYLATAGDLQRAPRGIAYGVSVCLSWVLLLTLPVQGMFGVVLVVLVGLGVYILPLAVTAVVLGLNSGVILLHVLILEAGPAEAVTAAGFYTVIQLATMFSSYGMLRQTELRAELEQRNTELSAATVLLEESVKTSERLRISRELHDLIGHQLTVLSLELEALRHRSSGQGRQHAERAALIAKELLSDVRATVGELRHETPGDLRGHLERLAEAVHSLDITLAVDDDVVADEQQTAALVRACQEIITNTIKHAEAFELSLIITADAEDVVLTGVNDGLAPHRIVHGHGLQGLAERVDLLGGRLTVTPRPRFTVEVRLPSARR